MPFSSSLDILLPPLTQEEITDIEGGPDEAALGAEIQAMKGTTPEKPKYYIRTDTERHRDNYALKPLKTQQNNQTWMRHWVKFKIECRLTFDDRRVDHKTLAIAVSDFINQIKPIKEGKDFKDSSISNAFSALQRYIVDLREEARITDPTIDVNVDFHNMPEYKVARDSKKARLGVLQRMGNTGKNSADSFTLEEQNKILACPYLDTRTPEGLVRKVFVVLSTAFCCRGTVSFCIHLIYP